MKDLETEETRELSGLEGHVSGFRRMYRDKVANLRSLEKPSVGWVSIYTPEEIIDAGGAVPFRITAGKSLSCSTARAALFSSMCSYSLSCLEDTMNGVYDFARGFVIVNTCDARRRLYDAMEFYVRNSSSYLIDLPKTTSSASKDYFRREIDLYKRHVEKSFGCSIKDRSLAKSIKEFNMTRRLLARLYDERKKQDCVVSGLDTLQIVKAATCGMRREFNDRMEALLTFIEQQGTGSRRRGPRILWSGSYCEEENLIELLEKSGATVVCEDISHGTKYFSGEVSERQEPLQALAEYYLLKGSCARMVDTQSRFDRLWQLVEDYNVDAVIYFSLKFCTNNLMDFVYLKEKLREKGTPVLFLEGEQSLVNLGQLKTRIQAFLEMIQ